MGLERHEETGGGDRGRPSRAERWESERESEMTRREAVAVAVLCFKGEGNMARDGSGGNPVLKERPSTSSSRLHDDESKQ